MSEELLGAKGLLDDMFLCLHVFNTLINDDCEDILLNNWTNNYSELKNHLIHTYVHILEKHKVMTQSVLSYTKIDD